MPASTRKAKERLPRPNFVELDAASFVDSVCYRTFKMFYGRKKSEKEQD